MLIQRFDLNRNIVAVSIFLNTAILPKKKLRFDPTWGSYNSGLKNYRISNNHIFGIARTSAFIWHTLDTSEKRLLRLHSFGPQVHRKSMGKLWSWPFELFHWIFAWFHIVSDKYTLDYAHFTFSDTIWPLLLSPYFGTQMITLAETASYTNWIKAVISGNVSFSFLKM